MFSSGCAGNEPVQEEPFVSQGYGPRAPWFFWDEQFTDGRCKIYKDNKFGYIDRRGN